MLVFFHPIARPPEWSMALYTVKECCRRSDVKIVSTSSSGPIVSCRRMTSGDRTSIILFRAIFFRVLAKPLHLGRQISFGHPILGLHCSKHPENGCLSATCLIPERHALGHREVRWSSSPFPFGCDPGIYP